MLNPWKRGLQPFKIVVLLSFREGSGGDRGRESPLPDSGSTSRPRATGTSRSNILHLGKEAQEELIRIPGSQRDRLLAGQGVSSMVTAQQALGEAIW